MTEPGTPGTLNRILAKTSPAKRQQIDEDIELAARYAIAREDKASVTITLELMPSEEGTHIDYTLYAVPKLPKSAAAVVRAPVDAKGRVEVDESTGARQARRDRENVVHIAGK